MDKKETKVINVRREHYDVYIGRGYGSIWGNPFEIGRDGTRSEVIKKYEQWILYSPEAEEQRKMLPSLKGKILGCWCKPASCHGDVLVKILNNME